MIRAKFMGREAVLKRLRSITPRIEQGAAAAQLEAAQELADAIQARAPVGPTGAYKRSIIGDKLANHPQGKAVGARGTKDPNATGIFADFKWRWLEFGTAERHTKDGASSGRMPAQPHIFPTYRAMRKRIRSKVARAINRAVKGK